MQLLLAVLSAGALASACAQSEAPLLPSNLSAPTASSSTSASSNNASAFARDSKQPSLVGERVVIKNPTLAQLRETGPLEDRTLGDPGAPVTMIEYGSWTCPHCRAFRQKTWPAFKRAYVDTGKVFYILREFPIGRSSGNAALVTRCAPKSKYFRLYDLYLKHQAEWVSQDVRPDKIFAVAGRAGMSRATFNACLKDEKLIAGINWQKNRGRELGVIGTPTFFINQTHVRSFKTMAEMRAIVDPMLAARTASN
ncbi:MAG: DsbA family protein [Pseudomonadota bacterium]